MTPQINQLPVKTIACHSLDSAVEIKHILAGQQRLVYEIYCIKNHQKITVKYGESAYQLNGERVYRQVFRAPGWPTYPAERASGDDFDWCIEQFDNLTRQDLYVTVWDLTDTPVQNPWQLDHETKQLEGDLIRAYIEQWGRAPIGNRLQNQRLLRGVPAVLPRTTAVASVLDQFLDITES